MSSFSVVFGLTLFLKGSHANLFKAPPVPAFTWQAFAVHAKRKWLTLGALPRLAARVAARLSLPGARTAGLTLFATLARNVAFQGRISNRLLLKWLP